MSFKVDPVKQRTPPPTSLRSLAAPNSVQSNEVDSISFDSSQAKHPQSLESYSNQIAAPDTSSGDSLERIGEIIRQKQRAIRPTLKGQVGPEAGGARWLAETGTMSIRMDESMAEVPGLQKILTDLVEGKRPAAPVQHAVEEDSISADEFNDLDLQRRSDNRLKKEISEGLKSDNPDYGKLFSLASNCKNWASAFERIRTALNVAEIKDEEVANRAPYRKHQREAEAKLRKLRYSEIHALANVLEAHSSYIQEQAQRSFLSDSEREAKVDQLVSRYEKLLGEKESRSSRQVPFEAVRKLTAEALAFRDIEGLSRDLPEYTKIQQICAKTYAMIGIGDYLTRLEARGYRVLDSSDADSERIARLLATNRVTVYRKRNEFYAKQTSESLKAFRHAFDDFIAAAYCGSKQTLMREYVMLAEHSIMTDDASAWSVQMRDKMQNLSVHTDRAHINDVEAYMEGFDKPQEAKTLSKTDDLLASDPSTHGKGEDTFARYTKVLRATPSIDIRFHTRVQADKPDRNFSLKIIRETILKAHESGYLIPRPGIDHFSFGSVFGSLLRVADDRFAFVAHTPPNRNHVETISIYPMTEARARDIYRRNQFADQSALKKQYGLE